MTQTDQVSVGPNPPPRRPRGRLGLWSLLTLLLLMLALGFAVLVLTGKPVRLPVWMVAEAEQRLNQALSDNALSIGAIEIAVDADWVPRLRLEDLRLLRADGSARLTLPDARLTFDPAALVRGQMRPRSLRLIGARIAVRRDAAGNFDLAFGEGQQAGVTMSSFAALLDQADALFGLPSLNHLTRIDAEALTVTLTDDRAGRTWEVGDGRLAIENRENEVAAELGLSLVGGGAAPAQAVMTFISNKRDAGARIAATFDQIAAADLAAQAGPLAWLGVLDAPISGRIAASLDAAGQPAALEAELNIGAGALRPTAQTEPIAFDHAAMRLAYDPSARRITLSELAVESPSLRLSASGTSYLLGPETAALPDGFLTQIAFSQVTLDPEGLFQEPLRFSDGALDLRLRLNPFSVEIGQLALVEGSRHLAAKGRIDADPAGWRVALDLSLNQIGHDGLLALWPVTLIPATRLWLKQNVQEGVLFDVKSALRLAPGTLPRLSLGYEFADADVRFLRTLPPIRSGYGYSTVEDETYTMVLSKGFVIAPQGGEIEMGGSVFEVADITLSPTLAKIRLKSDSSLTAALSLLDQPPFEFMKKANQPVVLGRGRAVLDTTLTLPLLPKVAFSDVDYQVTGTVSDLRSDVLVPGRVLTAASLALTANPDGIQIAGPGKLGNVPFDVTYSQAFGPQAQGRSRIAGEVELSQAAVTEFGLGLPQGMVSGTGVGRIAIELQRGAPPQLTLTSDLVGIGLSLPELGWTLPKNAGGKLEVAAELGSPPAIRRLALSGGGLQAEGSVTLQPGGALDVARFSRVRLNGWLDAAVDLRGRGQGSTVGIEVTGGTLDLRRMTVGKSGAADRGPPIKVALDRLTVAESIALTGFRGEFNGRGGFNGTFRAQVNGKARVEGTVAPSAGGSAVRIRSGDAGGVMAASGVFPNARGGAMDLQLTPRGPAGVYDGSITVTSFRIRNNSVLTELLSAISVIGLLELLDGEGLAFSVAQGEFLLTPEAIEMQRGSAVGASLGISMAGVYQSQGRRLALQGVISPIYLVNGIGALLTRRGEGLFGFNYTLRGTADNPEVRVNPLSILTPGMFRDIFRQPPPVLQREAG